MSTNQALAAESRVPQVIAGTIVPTFLGSIFVVARLYTRAIITRNWGLDDTFIAIAFIFSIGLAAGNCLLTRFGVGHHSIFSSVDDIISILKLAFASQLIYQFVLAVTKVGICLFYLRIFNDRTSKLSVYGLIAFVVLTFLPVQFAVVFRCHPVSDAWTIVSPNCGLQNPIVYASAACNIVADIMLMAFVIPRFLPLQMARRQKISLICIVSLGVLVIIAAITRLARVAHLATDPDLSWNSYDVTTWSSVEVSTGLFCASAPTIRPLLRQIAPGFMSSISQTFSGPTRTGTKSGMYGTGTHKSRLRGRDVEAFELRSNENELGNNGTGTVTTVSWAGNGKDKKKGSMSNSDEGDSQRSVLGAGKADEAILKTVSVTVTDGTNSSVLDREGDEGASTGQNSIVRFEHV
ncbi:hypothetical protein B0J14DRAFT_209952 [Halenospora varia]|nr:hypothetical protein B0J14DRAFT_209952 [Halenospora varia]